MPTPNSVLLDTHVLLWWHASSDRISRRASELIADATTVLISPITYWEVTMLVEKGRIALDRPTTRWANDVAAGESLELAAVTPTIAVRAGELSGFHGDPADRLIYATASTLDVPLISKDRRLHDYADDDHGVRVIW